MHIGVLVRLFIQLVQFPHFESNHLIVGAINMIMGRDAIPIARNITKLNT